MFTVPEDRYGIIYLITHIDSGRQYVGQTIGPRYQRWASHRHRARKGQRSYIHNAMLKHGVENFDIQTIDWACSKETLDHKEKFWIDFLDTKEPQGYNLKEGGSHGRLSEESKRRLSIACMGRVPYNKGMLRPEVGKKTGATLKRKYASGELKSRKGISRPVNYHRIFCVELNRWFDGHIVAAQYIQELTGKILATIVATISGSLDKPNVIAYGYHWQSTETIPPKVNRIAHSREVICIETQECFKSVTDATKIMKERMGRGGNISTVVSGAHKRAFGYHWRYVSENEESKQT